MVPKKCLVLAVAIQLFLSLSVTASENDDLLDFDFESVVKSEPTISSAAKNTQFDSAFDEFLDIIVEPTELGSQIQQKETFVKNKLARAWKNPNMQRQFAEVLPILKVMTSEQKIALAALVSAQVGSKQGRELNIDQVKISGLLCDSVSKFNLS